ncbi:hypothetical protein E2C01_049836 [Portunus trituberculatus]|uniref:Uncharacterized protein n=1 Tax=Portunus trituberculatus TaxID=210409 RepID=A0A5B7G7F5_PORTR|nr:hypothetical protein [Portunus trituberculatus]
MTNSSQQSNWASHTLGKDGITYDILNALLEVKVDNPILDLFNMSLTTGKLPNSWKKVMAPFALFLSPAVCV